MAAKKRGSGKKKSGSAAVAVATAPPPETDELFVPKGSATAAAATKTKTKSKSKTKAAHKDASSSGSDRDDSDNSDDGGVVELKVNEKFAKAFQEQKRKEELNRLERQRKLYGDDGGDDESESESETEDEDGEQLTRALDADIRKTLQLIRKKDPAIYDQSIAFFQKDDDDSDGSSDDDDGDASGKRKRKQTQKKDAPLYYKDLVRQQVIAGDVDSEDDTDKRDGRVMTYGEEQAKLKQDFLQSLKGAADDDDDDDDSSQKPAKTRGSDSDDDDDGDALDGGLFTIRKKTADEAQAEDAEYAAFRTKYGSALAKSEVDPDAFLEHYLSSEGWKDKRAAVPHYDDIVNNEDDDDDSADELERAEAFEHSYNFRFEEDGGGVIATHARHIDDTLRREDDSRKRKRAERKERKALERLKKEEELRRLKNLKQAELESKLAKVAKLMGKDTPEAAVLKLTARDLDGEFDPDEYDRRMQEVFDEEYYNDADDDAAAMEKPVWDDDEDRELFAGLPADSDDEVEGDDDDDEAAAAVNIVEPEEDENEDEDNDEDGEDAADDPLSADKVAGMSAAELARAKQKYLDELYALDYEDLIGDLKCRFKYRRVATNDFGLTADEIMAADDKELKALVSLKRLAPYQESEFQVDRKRVKQFKKTLAEVQRERQAKRQKKKQQQADDDAVADAVADTGAADAAPDAAVAGGKKRKRAKKSKAVAAAESEAAAPVIATESPTKASKKQKRSATASEGEAAGGSAAETEEQPVAAAGASKSDESKKKQRRSKKKSDGGAARALKATGLSTSRLESYKLTKAPGKKKHK